jgi:hypothetical protein
MERFKQFLPYINLVLLVLVFFRSCDTGSELKRLKKQTEEINAKVVSQEEFINIVETTVAWKTLRMEEISDKERVSINLLQARDEKE